MSVISNKPEIAECPICLDQYEAALSDPDKVVQLACSHFYHTDCLAQMYPEPTTNLATSLNCPTCSHPFAKINTPNFLIFNNNNVCRIAFQTLDTSYSYDTSAKPLLAQARHIYITAFNSLTPAQQTTFKLKALNQVTLDLQRIQQRSQWSPFASKETL